MNLQNFTYVFGLIATCFLISCGGETATKTEDTTKTETPAAQETVAKKYTLTPFSESPAYSDVKIKFDNYLDGKFSFDVSGTDYKLGEQTPDAPQKMCANSGKGQHIHLIIDNAPYSAQYTSSFEYDVPDGEHYMLAFLSRSYHESIKTLDAHTLMQVTVADKKVVAAEDFQGLMLNYSRPKGTYVGKANTEKVMLDFYLSNVQIGNNYFVKAEINGEEHMVDTWQPYYITGLPMGDNKIKLTLVNAKGEHVNSPRNPVERVFTLKADPAE
ncbi:MAG: hypothetical protein ACI9XO_000012 [Paraglaciecola sp.]|jgi:hypothetical protein